MNKSIQQLQHNITKEAPTILTILSIGGLFTSVGLAMRARESAQELLEMEAYRYKCTVEELDLTPKEKVAVVWKAYLGLALSVGLTTGCMLSVNSIHLKRNAALVALYSITSEALQDYQRKVVETIGERKELKLRDDLAQDKLDANPLGDNTIILSAGGEVLFYESLSGRYFRSNMENVRRAELDYNYELLTDMFKPLNDFYENLGIEGNDIGRASGWDVDTKLVLSFSTKLATNEEPCVVLNYMHLPKNL